MKIVVDRHIHFLLAEFIVDFFLCENKSSSEKEEKIGAVSNIFKNVHAIFNIISCLNVAFLTT